MNEFWTKERYAEYLTSEHWKSLRARKVTAIGGRAFCQNCGHRKGYHFEVHHLQYRAIFDVGLDDLIVLCVRCHEGVHKHGLAVRVNHQCLQRHRRKPKVNWKKKLKRDRRDGPQTRWKKLRCKPLPSRRWINYSEIELRRYQDEWSARKAVALPAGVKA